MGLTFNNEISVSDILKIASLIIAIIGGLFAFYQWRRNVSLKRANYINDLTEKIRTDKYIKDAVYLFDYDEIWYTEAFHGSGELELKIDKTLSYFSYICYLKKQRIITDKEFNFFRYEIERILMNNQTQDYLYNLYHFSERFKTPITFKYLFDYGKRRKLFDKQFFDKTAYSNSPKYHHYLNF